MEEEIWRDINYRRIMPDMYQVSNMGRIRNKLSGHIMAQCPSEKGYMMVCFRTNPEEKRSHCSIKIHKIVAHTFVSGFDKQHNEVDHINGDKTDNRASNLEWVTHIENIHRAYARELIPINKGEDHGNSKYSDGFVHYICRLLLWFSGDCVKVRMCLNRFGIDISRHWMWDLKHKYSWRHISDLYFGDDYFN